MTYSTSLSRGGCTGTIRIAFLPPTYCHCVYHKKVMMLDDTLLKPFATQNGAHATKLTWGYLITVEPPIKDPPRKEQPLIKDTSSYPISSCKVIHFETSKKRTVSLQWTPWWSQSVLCWKVPLYQGKKHGLL